MFSLDVSFTLHNGSDRFRQKLRTVLCQDMSNDCRRSFEYCCPHCLSCCPHIYPTGKKACRPFAFGCTCLLHVVFSDPPDHMTGCPRLCGLLTKFLSAEIWPVLGQTRPCLHYVGLGFSGFVSFLWWQCRRRGTRDKHVARENTCLCFSFVWF